MALLNNLWTKQKLLLYNNKSSANWKQQLANQIDYALNIFSLRFVCV